MRQAHGAGRRRGRRHPVDRIHRGRHPGARRGSSSTWRSSSTRTSRCWWTTPATPGCARWRRWRVETIRRGWQGRALAHHARAMALYPTPYFQKVAALLHQAQMGLVSDPHTGPLHARVRELLANGNLVCLGQDDISDAYYPFGRNNMLEVAFLASHLLWFTSNADIETLYDMVTVNAARGMGLRDFALRPGRPGPPGGARPAGCARSAALPRRPALHRSATGSWWRRRSTGIVTVGTRMPRYRAPDLPAAGARHHRSH